jgi:hypothetical protein
MPFTSPGLLYLCFWQTGYKSVLPKPPPQVWWICYRDSQNSGKRLGLLAYSKGYYKRYCERQMKRRVGQVWRKECGVSIPSQEPLWARLSRGSPNCPFGFPWKFQPNNWSLVTNSILSIHPPQRSSHHMAGSPGNKGFLWYLGNLPKMASLT